MIETLFKKLSSFKISLLLLLVIMVAGTFASIHRTYAAQNWAFDTNQTVVESLSACPDGANFGCSVSAYGDGILGSLNCKFTYNSESTTPNPYCPPKERMPVGYNGTIPSIAKLNQQFYDTPPANLALWVTDTGKSLGFIPKSAYAQGVGFTGLSSLLDIWKIFRNIAYVLLSLAIIVVGFMIMFRRKIDPQTVVSIQEALPRIIMALILITFSYAIVALLVDLMYVVLLLAYQLLLGAGLPESRTYSLTLLGLNIPVSSTSMKDLILNGNLVQIFGGVFPRNTTDIFDLATRFFNSSFITQAVGGVIGGFLLNILVLVLFIRLFFMFLGAYIQIILQLIFGPLYILSDVFPGSNNVGTWIKNIVANLGVFAIAGILFMLTIVFHERTQPNGVNSPLWVPPYSFINGNAESISALFSIGILLLIPSIINQFKQGIKAAGGPSLSGAFNMGPVTSIGGWAFGYLTNRQYHRDEMAAIAKRGGVVQKEGATSAVGKGDH